MTTVRRIGILSLGKVLGVLYAMLGLIVGAFFTLFAIIALAAGADTAAGPPLIFGAAAIMVFPLLYGIGGFLAGLIVALLYNVVAGLVGGIELELAHGPAGDQHPPSPTK